MPVYEYECSRCGYTSEWKVSIHSRDALPTCGHCGEVMKRKIAHPAIVIKDSIKAGGHDIPKL